MVQFPAEWEEHEAVWLAWPADESLWQEDLKPAQEEFIQLARGIADVDSLNGKPRGERLEILVPDQLRATTVQSRLGLPAEAYRLHLIPYGDIWLRDTAPLFVRGHLSQLEARSFGFNGWGEKYILKHDAEVAQRILDTFQGRILGERLSLIFEGGSIEVDGEGTVLTTRQCLLNPNRNPRKTQSDIEAILGQSLGLKKFLWLDEGLLNDHTDGHIDTLVRFVGPAHVVCMEARSDRDPNSRVLKSIAQALGEFRDSRGRKLTVTTIPSPGRVEDEDGEVLAASYVNFYIGNTTVVVPSYGSPYDQEAVSQLARVFKGRRVAGSSAKAILSGGGAFHCISQQQPKAEGVKPS